MGDGGRYGRLRSLWVTEVFDEREGQVKKVEAVGSCSLTRKISETV